MELRFIPADTQVFPANEHREKKVIRYSPHSNFPPKRVYDYYIMSSKETKFKQGMPVINPFLCDVNVKKQDQCPLLNGTLPNEVLDLILKLATPTSADKILLAVTCKGMAAKLFQARDQPLLRADVPRPLGPNDASAYVTKRLNFLKQLDKWMTEKDGWRLCVPCVKFKRVTGGGLGAGAEEWRGLKRKRGDDDIGICPKHRVGSATDIYHLFNKKRR
jgi:hypothetical protein